MKKVTPLLLSILLFIFASCSKDNYSDCALVSPVEPIAFISIEDSEGVSLLGEDNVFKPSEITLTRGTDTLFLDFSEGDDKMAIVLFIEQFESEEDYSLNLNDEESEILNLTLKLNPGKCFDVLSIEKFKLNGEEIQPENGAYIIQK
ncbi:hypothetical protein [Marixanthomonas ophiurae]|uniref:Lipoprotein n=1 Tax=Marixanthomonas ophiurae TaxID=387659 RepID=A0A3E1Q853_9FLAO|nr:hypothetical protein [Marixanthomonas ophiurae]RFN58319.1 hypothetical protein DZ858_13930 [Marixanthomonas ophiurae]